KGSLFPTTRDGASLYRIKWQWRAVGLVGAVFWVVVSIWSSLEQHSRPDAVLIGITVAFVIAGLWLASGSVTTNQTGITKKGLWHSHSFQWKDITEVRLHKKRGVAIELRSGGQKLVIDSRLDAFQHLLNEIEDQTQLHPTAMS